MPIYVPTALPLTLPLPLSHSLSLSLSLSFSLSPPLSLILSLFLSLAEAKATRLGESGRTNLRRAAQNLKSLGWMSFWAQLALTLVSIVITIFSVAFTREASQVGQGVGVYRGERIHI